jgi:hypothetical protein
MLTTVFYRKYAFTFSNEFQEKKNSVLKFTSTKNIYSYYYLKFATQS